MRKHSQQQITEMLRTLGEAHDEMKKPGVSEQIETILRLLEDCQNMAVHIGNFIENLEGEGTKTVALLEEYCELLYRTGLAASDGSGGNAANQIKRLQKQIVVIENSVRDELAPNRIETVFLPYKASMWDSMESVWLAAKDDPACDAYVVPVPYYDKQQDGALGRMRYEGGDYPAYVPVVDYRKYNFEERRPDIVVIHSPYDGGNLVTGVHPDFYSERLKAFTDLLVYIPYFVVLGDVPEHFCVCAGTIHADRVVVQSEKIRETYIRVFKEFEKKNNCKGRFGKPETKFLALGSPKFDKVLSTKREDCEIPRAWRRLIEKPDGTRKNVVLYNTSIGALLEGDEKMLVKLRGMLALFRERNDTVLWWRPHPLNEATYRAMRPQLLREYESIVAEYRRAGLGIYDDTADLHRAIAQSDAYCGDGSSLVAMYLVTGKPAMIQNANILPENGRDGKFFFNSCYDDGETIWFSAYLFNGLFRVDKDTWKAEYLGSFPEERPDGFGLFGGVSECNGKLFFAPMSAGKIAVYDIKTGAYERIELVAPDADGNKHFDSKCKFTDAVTVGNKVFLIPSTYPAIAVIDSIADSVVYVTDWLEGIEKIRNENAWFFFGNERLGNKLFISVCCANAVLILDVEKLTCSVRPLLCEGGNYNGICYDGADFWLTPCRLINSSVKLVKWNEESDKTEIIEAVSSEDCFDVIDKVGMAMSLKPIYCAGYIYIIPHCMNRSIRLHTVTYDINPAPAFGAECETDAPPALFDKYSAAWQYDNTIYALGGRSRMLTVYNTASGSAETVAITAGARRIPTSALTKNPDFCSSPEDFIYSESGAVGAEEFVDIATNFTDADFMKKQAGVSKEANMIDARNAGNSIYSHCKNLVLS